MEFIFILVSDERFTFCTKSLENAWQSPGWSWSSRPQTPKGLWGNHAASDDEAQSELQISQIILKFTRDRWSYPDTMVQYSMVPAMSNVQRCSGGEEEDHFLHTDCLYISDVRTKYHVNNTMHVIRMIHRRLCRFKKKIININLKSTNDCRPWWQGGRGIHWASLDEVQVSRGWG